MALTLANLEDLTRLTARNAQDPTMYNTASIDTAIQQAYDEWIEITQATRTNYVAQLTTGSNVLPTFPAGLLPEFCLNTILTLNGFIVDPDIVISTRQECLYDAWREIGNYVAASGVPPLPRQGPPKKIGFYNSDLPVNPIQAICFPTPDKNYSVEFWWVQPLPYWVPGNGVGPTSFLLPDEHLRVIAGPGAAYYLQKAEPENREVAMEAHNLFTQRAIRVRNRGGSSRGEQVMTRVHVPGDACNTIGNGQVILGFPGGGS